MCGIAGVIDLQGRFRLPEPALFDRMVDTLARRGPDGRGVWRTDTVAFGHRRLAILDPTSASDQPMVRDGVAIVFNGEIYNFRELRRELEALGHTFSTSGDTEVLLGAYRQWGDRCVDRLNGIFAFVVVDTTKDADNVLLARDHTGIKPLFYRLDDGLLWFGSELKAILRDPRVPRRHNPEALDCFLALAWVPPQLTPFESIEQLAPATTMTLSLSPSVGAANTRTTSTPKLRRYWRPVAREQAISLNDAVHELDTRLSSSVQAQLVSDVPLGAFLSGGLDSASVVHAMRKSGPVRTFSMGFTERSFDESDDAAHTASALGASHHSERVDLDLAQTVLALAETNDDLLGDASMLAVDRLCALTRRHVTVALSGDGADEILGGYPTYIAAYLARGWRHAPQPLRSFALATAKALPATTTRYNLRDFSLRFLGAAERSGHEDFAAFRIYFDDDTRRALLKHADVDGRPLGRYARAVDEAWGDTLLKRLLIADLTHYLPADMLVKVDRASMRHGLEVRVPFLDPSFIDFALSLPSSMLVSPTGETKKVLRRHVRANVSPRIAAGKKRGFSVPVGAAFKGALGDVLLAELSRDVVSEGPVDVGVIRRVLDAHRRGEADFGLPLYTALVFCLWWRRFVVDEDL
jgi:asparagine synthase (glutamine-hydrolysing)